MTNLSKETQAFLEDYDAVCRKHGLQIDPDVWPMIIDWDEYCALSEEFPPHADNSRYRSDQ